MPFDLLNLFDSPEVTFLVKIATLVFLAIYIVFAFVILTQVKVMNRILRETFASNLLMFLALGNVILALSLFAVALVIL